MWKVHEYGTFLKFESAAHYDEGMCLAVVHPDKSHEFNMLALGGHGHGMGFVIFEEVDEICTGQLGLLDCNHPGTNWFNTGGQFLSASCWNQGVSAAMSVDESCTDLILDSSSSAQAPSVSLAPTTSAPTDAP
eukprot:scaffold2731_cov154-Skeletonema_dohrnii-CCMP3373.AAC.2